MTDAAGGLAVPFTLDPSVIGIDGLSINPFRRIARVVQTTTDSWNGVTGTAASASWDSEGVEVSDDSITLAQPSIPVYKAQMFVPFSVEIQGDWAAIESDLRTAMTEGRDNLEAAGTRHRYRHRPTDREEHPSSTRRWTSTRPSQPTTTSCMRATGRGS